MPSPKTWYKLDNAATVFPGQNTSRWSNIFRFSVVLDRKIDPEILEDALSNVLVRFPCYDVRIRRGLFWYYFEKNPNGAPPVEPDVVNPCHRVKFKENSGYLFRIYYYEKRISGDFYHALTDGMGAVLWVTLPSLKTVFYWIRCRCRITTTLVTLFLAIRHIPVQAPFALT